MQIMKKNKDDNNILISGKYNKRKKICLIKSMKNSKNIEVDYILKMATEKTWEKQK